jgi:flagellar biosynthetic protein FliP
MTCRRDPFAGRPARLSTRLSTRGTLALSAAFAVLALVLIVPHPALAQKVNIDLGGGAAAAGGGLTGRLVQLVALMTVLSLAPGILVVMTCFTRIVVVLSLLRSAIGMTTTPPNSVMVSLALFLTAFIMAPVLERSYQDGIAPLVAEKITEEQAFDRATAPLKGFMLQNVREQDLKLFADIAKAGPFASDDAVPLQIVVPSFLISELRRAFEIGFLLFVPFLIIDMVVASILMSMGMMMLPPITISLPFKIIFFVLVDGWYMVAGSLVRSYAT